MSEIIVIGRDELITLTGLFDNQSSQYVSTANVEASIKDENEEEIETFTLNYLDDTNGNYQGILTAAVTAELTPYQCYSIDVTAVVTSSGELTITYKDRLCVVAQRKSGQT